MSNPKLGAQSRAHGKGLSKAVLNSALDELIKTFEEANRKLDDLLAKAKDR